MAESKYSRSYSTFSGVDVTVTFGGKKLGSMQGISYTVTREKAPSYVMGRANPLSFSRGKRGIAGSMIMLVLDRSNLIYDLDDTKFWASPGDKHLDKAIGASNTESLTVHPVASQAGSTEYASKQAWYHDQILPFNAVLTAMTEYGLAARMAIVGIEILNSGSGISIDDITTDENMTFVARDIIPWRMLGYQAGAGNPAVSAWSITEETIAPPDVNFT